MLKGPRRYALGPSTDNYQVLAGTDYCTIVIRFAAGGAIGVVGVELAVR